MFLPPKKPHVREEVLLELMKDQEYTRLKETWGHHAREYCRDLKEQYHAIWYFAIEEAKRKVIQSQTTLVREGALSEEEADDIYSDPPPSDDIALEHDEAVLDSLEVKKSSNEKIRNEKIQQRCVILYVIRSDPGGGV